MEKHYQDRFAKDVTRLEGSSGTNS